MRAMLPSIATLAILCAACSDTSTSTPLSSAYNNEAVASVVGGVTYPLVAITPAISTIKLADSASLQAKLTNAGTSWFGRYMTWTSSDTTVLKIKITGVGNPSGSTAHLYALKPGTVTITATTQSKTSASKSIVVGTPLLKDTVIAKVSVTPNPINISTGKTYQLIGVAYDAKGTAITGAKLTWRSTNAAILTVSSTGMVSGKAKGTANVEAAAANGKMAWSGVTDTGGVATTPPVAPVVPPVVPGGGVAAVWTGKFVGSVGVGTHFSYFDLLPYQQGASVAQTIAAVKALGVSFVRDGVPYSTDRAWSNIAYGPLQTLAAAGVRTLFVVQPKSSGDYTSQNVVDTAVARIGASGLLAFEGPNEVDNNNGNWGGVPAFGANARGFQAAMYQHAKQIAPGVTVIGLTTTSSWGAADVGDISAYMDAGTLHPYPSASVPTAYLASTEATLAPLNGAHKGWWVTETGYYTAPNATQNVYQPGVSEAAQGKYVPRLYLDYFNAGISHTSVYELIDEHSSQSDAEANYGMLRNDGSAKPAYTALKNMLGVLADPGGQYAAGSLNFSVAGTTGTIRQALFQKRDGRFYLVLWNDVLVYNTNSKSDISNAAVPVTVTFGVQPRSVMRYQPVTSAAGTSVTAAKSIVVSVPDSPVILEITQ